MTVLQASLLSRPSFSNLSFSPLSSSSSSKLHLLSISNNLHCYNLSFSPKPLRHKSQFRRYRHQILSCLMSSESNNTNFESSLNGDKSIPDLQNQQSLELPEELTSGNPKLETEELSTVECEAVDYSGNDQVVSQSNNAVAKERESNRLPILVFLMGVFASIRRGFEKLSFSEWLNWWPFWRQEKRLERLIAEADANPKDAVKQSALLAELNKQSSPESVIRRFEQRDHAVDSKGVAEYLRALVVTNAITDYLPDEQSGKPASLPSLLQELKQRASGNMDDPFMSPGISDKQPLHVVMVDPKSSNRSARFAQEVISTILFTVAVGLMWSIYIFWW